MSLRYWPPGYWGRAKGVTALPLADFPPAAGHSGLILGASNVGPAPGIQLVSNGTLWRPVNGSAVLATRSANPVTVQTTAGLVAETLGPFPGGLVRADMRLELDLLWTATAVSGGTRFANLRIGNSTPANNFAWDSMTTNNGTYLVGRTNGIVGVVSNTPATHNGAMGSGGSSFTTGITNQTNPTVDFSQPWIAEIHFQSASETAITITGATWSANVATITATAHTLAVGDKTIIGSVNPSGYNGTVIVTTVPNANTFTYALTTDPGAYVSGGTSTRISNVVSKSYVLTLFG